MAEQEKVRTFVLNLLAASGCRMQRKDDVWSAHLPKHMAEAFGVAERFLFTFHPKNAGANVETLTIGHRVLDQMVQYAQRRGRACNVIFVGSQWNELLRQAVACNPWGKAHDRVFTQCNRLVEKMRSLRFANARQRIIQRRVLYQRQALFRFRVAFCADEKREMLVSVLADPVTESVDSMVDLAKGVAMPVVWRGRGRVVHWEHGDSSTTSLFGWRKTLMSREGSWQAGEAALRQGNSYVWFRLYRKACGFLEERIRADKARFEAEAKSRLAVEKKRLDSYYRGMASETIDPLRRVFRRMTAAEIRMGWRRDGDTGDERLERLRAEALKLQNQHLVQLENLEAEQKRRLEELLERYQVRTEVSLAQVALTYVPRIAWTLRLSGPSRREVTVLYDIMRERIIEPQCDVCECTLSSSAWLSCCGDMICQRCFDNHCPTCAAQITLTTGQSETDTLHEVGG